MGPDSGLEQGKIYDGLLNGVCAKGLYIFSAMGKAGHGRSPNNPKNTKARQPTVQRYGAIDTTFPYEGFCGPLRTAVALARRGQRKILSPGKGDTGAFEAVIRTQCFSISEMYV